jgi:hypothetical protein
MPITESKKKDMLTVTMLVLLVITMAWRAWTISH